MVERLERLLKFFTQAAWLYYLGTWAILNQPWQWWVALPLIVGGLSVMERPGRSRYLGDQNCSPINDGVFHPGSFQLLQSQQGIY